MQYFVGIESARDVYADNDRAFQRICNVNGTSDCSSYYSSLFLPSPTAQVLVNTEFIKQTIFSHEAIFRSQVMELHRLYNKQREIMIELKNDCNRDNNQVRQGSSEYGLMEEKQPNVSWLSPYYVPQSVAHTNHFQLKVGENVHTYRGTRPVECTSPQTELLDSSRCKKYNNKVLDLQLLATEYMDDEDATSSIVAEATYPVRYTPPFSTTNDEHVDQQPLVLGIHENGTYAESASARPILFDLNEPFNFEEATPTTSHEEKLFEDLSRNTTQLVSCSSGGTDKNIHGSVAIYNDVNNHDSTVQLNCNHEPGQKTTDSDPLSQDSNPSSSVISAVYPSLKPKPCNEHLGIDNRLKRSSKKRTVKSRKAQGCLASSENKTQDTLIRVPKSLQPIPVCDMTETHSKHILSPMESMFDFRRNPIAVQALPCMNAPGGLQKKKSKSFSTVTGPDRKNSLLSDVQRCKAHTQNCLLSPSTRKCKKRRTNLRASNVNRGSYRMEPPSPENEECTPPRRESDENFLEKRRQFFTPEYWDTESDVARIAAKAIVFLSAADGCINRHSVFEPSLLSPDNPLHWFAELVSNMEFAAEGLPASIESRKDSMFHSIDDFETMTLKLEDTKKEENYCRSIIAGQDEKLTLVTIVSGRATRARGKRSKKLKDFQGVVLPGISSLSKHEVTEDLHLIEGLTEAAGTPNIFGSKKRNGCSRSRRQSSNPASIIADNSPCLLLDFHNETSNESLSNERKHVMIDWGKITRRRRGQRYPARKLTFIQVAHTLNAH